MTSVNDYQKSIEEILKELSTSPQGISEKEALLRIKKYGFNELRKIRRTPLFIKFLNQFKDLLALILIAAALLAFLIGEPKDMLIILGIVLINAIIGFVQEYKAQRILAAFSKHLPSYSKVIRDGEIKKILSFQIVPGDILILEAGDTIGADARLTEAFDFSTNDFSLTGESQPQEKRAYQIEEIRPLCDVDNMVFAGTSAANGNAKAVVVKTGMETEFGKIAKESQEIKEELTPLQKELNHIGKTVFKLAVGIAIFIVALLYLFGRDFKESLFFGIVAGAAMVPEGLPAAISVSLSLGAQRMIKRKALVKKLLHVETLGSTTVICTDKTGTLTTSEMSVLKVFAKNKDLFIKTAVLCNNAKLGEKAIGDPLEIALLKYAQKEKVDFEKIQTQNSRVFEIPFSSQRKMMSVICQKGKNYSLYIKGAVSEILDRCGLPKQKRDEIIKENDEMAKSGLRILALASKDLGQNRNFNKDAIERDLTYLGLVALEDPPREGVKEAIEDCKKAGIKTIMITGDYGLTASAIAKKINLNSEKVKVITGSDLHKMDDDKLKEALKEEVLFARIEPGQKLRIVKNLKEQGEVVAVTGDGVNDVPALVAADIGVAMGKIGTDVTKEAGDMILLDDHFATIVHAIKEGRQIFDNLKRIIFYVFSSNAGELLTPLIGILLGLPLPLIAVQILAIDLGTDVFPSLALGAEKEEPKIMQNPPRQKGERIMNLKMLYRLFGVGFVMAFLALLAFLLSLYEGGWKYGGFLADTDSLYFRATATAYATIVLCQVANAFSIRSEKFSIFKLGFLTNRRLLYAELISFLMLLALMVYQPLQNIFRTVSPSPLAWVLILLSFFVFLAFSEWRKKRALGKV